MARDWRTVALAVLAAAMLASVCAGEASAQAREPDQAAAAKKRQDPAEAQRSVAAAAKLVEGGKSEQAIQSLSATLAGGNLPPAIMARALYLRGMAYRQQSKPAQAISDLTSALWLKGGLTAEDRADALKHRAGAYADAGLTERGEGAPAKTAGANEQKERPAAKSWGAVTTPVPEVAPASSQTAQGGNWFKNWFSAWTTPQAQANTPPATASIEKADTARPPPAAAKPRISSAWSSNTEVHAAAAAPDPPRRNTKADGKYRVQLATVRTQREAEALAVKAKRSLGELVAGGPEIDRAVLGNMGAFYRVRVGPFATVREAQAVCAKVEGTGFDCLTVTQ